jgi:phosphoglycolate phosphatase
MLDELEAAGRLLAIATGKTRAGLERALAQQGVAERFVATRCADESPPKPHPGMLLHLMEQLGVEPAATLMVGDTTHDLELARNARVAALAYPTARTNRQASRPSVRSRRCIRPGSCGNGCARTRDRRRRRLRQRRHRCSL